MKVGFDNEQSSLSMRFVDGGLTNPLLKVKVGFGSEYSNIRIFSIDLKQKKVSQRQDLEVGMEQNRMLSNLQAISKEATSCTLVANKGERIEVEIDVIFSLKCLNLYFFMDIFHVQIFLFVVFSCPEQLNR